MQSSLPPLGGNFALEYLRKEAEIGKSGQSLFLPFPPWRGSYLRACLDDHLMQLHSEIDFSFNVREPSF